MYLSKSKYCSAVQCPKMLWLKKNKNEVYDDSVLNMAVLEQGSEVGDLARGLFGDFVEVPYGDLANMLTETERLMAAGAEIIAEASFSYKGLFCSVDILKNIGTGHVELYEVKSSGMVHDIYYDDAAYQYYVLKKLGYIIDRICIVHINTSYVRGEELDLKKLFTVVDVTTEATNKFDEVEINISGLEAYMKQKREPEDDISVKCFDPYDCGFFKYCSRHLPSPNVFDVAKLSKKRKFEYYNQGLRSFKDLYDSGELTKGYLTQVEHEVLGLKPHIDVDAIKSFLGKLYYPIYFLDFETFTSAIPLYKNSSPYQQIPFQYSLHYIEHEGGVLKHKEFLAEAGEDPRRKLAERLCEDIPEGACATAYNMGFEKGRLNALAQIYPDLSDTLTNIHDNIVDLMIPFQKKQYYQKEMKGSYSIKYVLPALFPDEPSLNYSNLEGIHNGSEASNAFRKMGEMKMEEAAEYRRHLLEYCKLDTYAMVKIWQKLHEVAGDKVNFREKENNRCEAAYRNNNLESLPANKNQGETEMVFNDIPDYSVKRCIKCGAELRKSAIYCDQCGAKLEQEAEEHEDEQSKKVAESDAKKTGNSSKEAHPVKYAYWKNFIEHTFTTDAEHAAKFLCCEFTLPEPADRSWYAIRLGTAKARIELQISTRKNMIRAALFIKDKKIWDKAAFLLSKVAYDKQLIHVDLASKVPSISVYKSIDGIDVNEEEQYDWLMKSVLVLKEMYDVVSK